MPKRRNKNLYVAYTCKSKNNKMQEIEIRNWQKWSPYRKCTEECVEGKEIEGNFLVYTFLCCYALWIMSVHYLLKVKLVFKSLSENKPRKINLTIYQFSNITTQKTIIFSPKMLWPQYFDWTSLVGYAPWTKRTTKKHQPNLTILLFWNYFLILHNKANEEL